MKAAGLRMFYFLLPNFLLRGNGRTRRRFGLAAFPWRLRRGFGAYPAAASHHPAALCKLAAAYIVSVIVVRGDYSMRLPAAQSGVWHTLSARW